MEILKNLILILINYLRTEIQKSKIQQIERENSIRDKNILDMQLQLQYELYRVFNECSTIHVLQKINYVYDLAPNGYKLNDNGYFFAFIWEKVQKNNAQPMTPRQLQNLVNKLNGLIDVFRMRLNNDLTMNPYNTQLYNEFPLILAYPLSICYCKELANEIQIVVCVSQ